MSTPPADLEAPAYSLLVREGPDRGRRHRIQSGRATVGTSPEMDLVLTDPAILPHHFVVMFVEGGWLAVTYDPATSIVVDRRWVHPRTGHRGARILAGRSELLLYPGDQDPPSEP